MIQKCDPSTDKASARVNSAFLLQRSITLELTAPECDGPDGEGVVVNARGGESNSQHVLFCGDVLWASDAVQIIHVAGREKGRENI